MFVVELITGIILWLPKRWKYIKNNFRIRKKKLNLDLHNTLEGILFPFLLLAALIGLIWSFTWFSKAVYSLTGGNELKPYVLPESDIPEKAVQQEDLLDILYRQLKERNPKAPTFYFALPSDTLGVFRVSIVHKRNSYYQTDNLFFDQYTLNPLEGQGPYAGKYTEVSTADKIRRMNLDIHDGRILGIFRKIIAFCSSFTGVLLFITGFVLWQKSKRKKRSFWRSSWKKRIKCPLKGRGT